MTTSISPSLNPHSLPVTPPPETLSFPIPQRPEKHQEPFDIKAFQNSTLKSDINAQFNFQHKHQQQPQTQPDFPLSQHQQHQQHQQESQTQSSFLQMPPVGPPDAAAATLDPKYLAMVSRIAAYYQQRCHAIANYQQQRCQAWATMHRQKCQEMVQAAMLVVAWYIRDRIKRRRRRQKRQFRKGLTDRCSSSKVTKGEVVRRWVLRVPDVSPSPNEPSLNWLVDKEEAEFNIEKEQPIDKDTRLFSVADNLIKSQLAKIEVPLMGALSFDESESESEDEPMEAENEEGEDTEGEQDARDVAGGEEEELYDGDLSIDDYEDDELDSGIVQNGTGDGSLAKERMQDSSLT